MKDFNEYYNFLNIITDYSDLFPIELILIFEWGEVNL